MTSYKMNLRRNRKSHALRELLKTVEVHPTNLIQPYFIYESLSAPQDLASIRGQKKHTKDSVLAEIERGLKNGVNTVLLFFIPEKKASSSWDYSFDVSVLKAIKERFGAKINLLCDMCICSQTESGHCGIVLKDGTIDNEKSVSVLVEKSVVYAKAGADAICPSDMMDSRVAAIREGLDLEGLDATLIMSYSTKFASHMYGPFRDAAESTPESGDRKSYQIDFRNENDAISSSLRDVDEGADILMVKPAGFYLDMLYRIKTHPQMSSLPLAAYQVSGEYQSLHVMADNNLIDFKNGYYESLVAIKRSGADLIITYGANDFNEIMSR